MDKSFILVILSLFLLYLACTDTTEIIDKIIIIGLHGYIYLLTKVDDYL